MKKLMFVLAALLLLSSPCLAVIYTLTGYVYYGGTSNVVPNASVYLTGGGCTVTGTANTSGRFTLQCSSNPPKDSQMILTATAPAGFFAGQRKWYIPQSNTQSQTKNIDVWPTIQSSSSLQMPSISTNLLGSPGESELVAPFQLQATGAIVPVQNAQINIAFNGAIQDVNDVVPTTATTAFSYDVPVPGQLVVNVEFPPGKEVPPDFPAESFFDVFFEVEIPESGAVLGKVTIEQANFNELSPGVFEFSGIPSLTEHLIGEYEYPSPYFFIDSEEEWQFKLDTEWPDVIIRGLSQEEGDAYLLQLKDFELPDSEEHYSPADIYPDLPEFIPPRLLIYPGGDDGQSSPVPDPEDAGLIMTWGDDPVDPGERASAWKLSYDDPDLSNCIITVTATPPSASGINRISIGMQDVNGNVCSWWWVVPTVIPFDVPTVITVDTTQINAAAGVGLAAATAATGPASGCAINPAFDLKQVASIIADENANLMGGTPAPAPGGQSPVVWNYWHNLSVTPKSPSGGANSKWYLKWSQPPVVLNEPEDPALIDGWDEVSIYDAQTQGQYPIMADDWQCDTDRPVTDIHWWGSFKGWTQPHLPPIVPSKFHIAIWTDQPDLTNPTPGIHDGVDWSHPLTLVWENFCDTAVWNFAGYDLDPRDGDPDQQENEACFQWAQFLSQDEWFHQEEGTNIYWVSIAAIYDSSVDFADPDFYPWGWKTRPHHFNDDAVRILQTSDGTTWPPVLGSTLTMTNCDPIHIDNISWDLAFELTTNEPGYVDDPIPGDVTGSGGDGIPDGTVDLNDLVVVASHWLEIAP